MLNRSFITLFGFLFAFTVSLTQPVPGSSGSPAAEHVKLELVSEQNAVVPGKELWLGIRFDLEDGWHTYWINPGDSGEAPRIEWHLPAGFEAGAIQWPYPERLATSPFADYGYEHQVLLMIPVRPAAELKEGQTQKVAALVHYLVCRDVCIPGQKQLDLSLPVQPHAAASEARELFDTDRSKIPRAAPRNWKISAASIADELLLNLKIGKLDKAPQFFPLNAEQIENGASQETTAIPGGIRLHLKKSKHLLKPVGRLRGIVVLGPGRAYVVDVPVSQAPGRAKRN
ncbi:MAG TPA: protein-disulfide reductase DsbD domain-containing protein [Terriglobales bacterium]|nr:protein-disulfide reductase DsbD domain-containing protein [Terriglobales bacterium]